MHILSPSPTSYNVYVCCNLYVCRPANLESKKILRFLYLYCSIAVCSKKKLVDAMLRPKKKKKKKKVSTFLKNREIRSAALEQGSKTVRLTVNP